MTKVFYGEGSEQGPDTADQSDAFRDRGNIRKLSFCEYCKYSHIRAMKGPTDNLIA